MVAGEGGDGGGRGSRALGSVDKRHFVGVRFVLSNTHISLPLSWPPPLCSNQAVSNLGSKSSTGEKKEACYFEESRVNNGDKRFRHKKEEKKEGREGVKKGKITRHPILFPSFG